MSGLPCDLGLARPAGALERNLSECSRQHCLGMRAQTVKYPSWMRDPRQVLAPRGYAAPTAVPAS